MKIKIAIAVLAIIVLAAVIWSALGTGEAEITQIVPAWQLTSAKSYDSNALVDPIVSWSPDSKSVLFESIGAKYFRGFICQWNVGDKKITRLVEGFCPNYISSDKFLYLKTNPRLVVEHDLVTKRERPIAQDLPKWDLWRELTGFSYDPARKTLALRFAKYPRYYEPGCEEADLTGKYLGKVSRTTGDGVLDRSNDPKGERTAVILGDLTGVTRQLRIARPGEEAKAKTLVENDLGAVAWSPDGRTVAFAEANEVRVLNPDDGKIVTVARLGESGESGAGPYVCRLAWSPDSAYLAAVELVPGEENTFMMIYVLDMR